MKTLTRNQRRELREAHRIVHQSIIDYGGRKYAFSLRDDEIRSLMSTSDYNRGCGWVEFRQSWDGWKTESYTRRIYLERHVGGSLSVWFVREVSDWRDFRSDGNEVYANERPKVGDALSIAFIKSEPLGKRFCITVYGSAVVVGVEGNTIHYEWRDSNQKAPNGVGTLTFVQEGTGGRR